MTIVLSLAGTSCCCENFAAQFSLPSFQPNPINRGTNTNDIETTAKNNLCGFLFLAVLLIIPFGFQSFSLWMPNMALHVWASGWLSLSPLNLAFISLSLSLSLYDQQPWIGRTSYPWDNTAQTARLTIQASPSYRFLKNDCVKVQILKGCGRILPLLSWRE